MPLLCVSHLLLLTVCLKFSTFCLRELDALTLRGLEQLEQTLVVHLVEIGHLLVLEILLLHLHLLLYDVLLRHLRIDLSWQNLLLLGLLGDLLSDLLVRQALCHDLLLSLHLVLLDLLRNLRLLLAWLLLETCMLGLVLLREVLLGPCNS